MNCNLSLHHQCHPTKLRVDFKFPIFVSQIDQGKMSDWLLNSTIYSASLGASIMLCRPSIMSWRDTFRRIGDVGYIKPRQIENRFSLSVNLKPRSDRLFSHLSTVMVYMQCGCEGVRFVRGFCKRVLKDKLSNIYLIGFTCIHSESRIQYDNY